MKKSVFIFVFVILLIGIVSADSLKVTQEHPFLINGEWVIASSLKIGDELTTLDGFKVKIINIKDINLDFPVDVYNLEAGVFQNFVVSRGVVVHNSKIFCDIYPKYDSLKNMLLEEKIAEYNKENPDIEPLDRLKQLPSDYREAIEKFIINNQRLAIIIAKRYSRGYIPEDELETLAFEGVMKAAIKFDESKGVKLMSYATWWIRYKVLRELRRIRGERLKIKYLPEDFYDIYYEIDRINARYRNEGKISLTEEEIISELEKKYPNTATSIKNLYAHYEDYTQCVRSFDEPYPGSDDVPTLEDIKAKDPREILQCRERDMNINSLLETDILNEKQKNLIRLRYNKHYTLEETSIGMGIYEGDYPEETLEFAIERYREEYLKQISGEYTNKKIQRIFERIKLDVIEKYGGDPNFLTRERVRQIQMEAEFMIRSRLIWEKLGEAIKFENELFTEGSVSALDPSQGKGNMREVVNLYHGFSLIEDNNIIYLTQPSRRYSFKEIAVILGMSEYQVRRTYRSGLNNLNQEYDLLLEKSEEFYNLHFPNKKDYDWSSINGDPSLCKPLPGSTPVCIRTSQEIKTPAKKSKTPEIKEVKCVEQRPHNPQYHYTFNSETREIFPPNSNEPFKVKFYDRIKGLVFFKKEGKIRFYNERTHNTYVYSARQAKETGRVFYDEETKSLLINIKQQGQTPEFIGLDKPFYPVFDSKVDGRRIFIYNDIITSRPMIYIEGERIPRILKSLVAKKYPAVYYESGKVYHYRKLKDEGGVYGALFYDSKKNVVVFNNLDLETKRLMFWPYEKYGEVPKGRPEGLKSSVIPYNPKYGTEFTDVSGQKWKYNLKKMDFDKL